MPSARLAALATRAAARAREEHRRRTRDRDDPRTRPRTRHRRRHRWAHRTAPDREAHHHEIGVACRVFAHRSGVRVRITHDLHDRHDRVRPLSTAAAETTPDTHEQHCTQARHGRRTAPNYCDAPATHTSTTPHP